MKIINLVPEISHFSSWKSSVKFFLFPRKSAFPPITSFHESTYLQVSTNVGSTNWHSTNWISTKNVVSFKAWAYLVWSKVLVCLGFKVLVMSGPKRFNHGNNDSLEVEL